MEVFRVDEPLSMGPISLTDTEGLTMIDNIGQGE